jgi:hypothetical protein
MKPSVGRIVHYVSYGSVGGAYPSVCRAAVVTEVVNPDVVSLCVLNPEGMFFNKELTYDEGHTGGTWHWPERVEE